MVAEVRPEYDTEWAAMKAVVQKLGIGTTETLRKWVRQDQVGAGVRPGVTTEESAELKRLKKEHAALKGANEILKAATPFLEAEPDRPHTRSWRSSTSAGAASAVSSRSAVCWLPTTARSPPPPTTPTRNAGPRRPPGPCGDGELKRLIQHAYDANYRVYGARKIWRELNRQGQAVARCTVERLMREPGIAGAVRGRSVITTLPGGRAERARDLMDRDFVAAAPNRCRVADFTRVKTWAGVVHVAFVDAFSRRIVGWSAATVKETVFVLDALEMAIWQRDRDQHPVQPGELIHHSDAGSQYTSFRLAEHLDAADIELATAEYVDWYDYRRLHGEIGHVPPVEYENNHYRATKKPQVTANI
ncbi:IS3 family transposase [Streptomyces sp. NPDC046685]|uniref:IS3 family transposase n=1 Tax=Streptomyces sp. NPDC046685 TaxID=3157202 RepID=UPI0033C6BEF1